MNFLRERRIMALAVVLILGFLPILGAQDEPKVEDFLPGSRDLHLPESSISKATIGTLSGDADAFMSTVDWGSIENFDSTFVLGGFDEWGLALGFAKKFGKVYLGASYSGDLIDEVYRRITNKERETFWKVDSKDDAPTPNFDFYLEDENENSPGSVVSNNDINIIVGVGIFGGRLGFSEYIRSVQNSSPAPYWAFTDSLETSLKPNLELGFKIPAGKVTIKPSLRGALDIRQFRSAKGDLDYDFKTNPATPQIYWRIRDNKINFIEPSGGLTIAVEFALSDTSSMEFALGGDGYFRIYPGANDPGSFYATEVRADASTGYPALPLFKNGSTYLLTDGTPYAGTITPPDPLFNGIVTVPLDFWATGAPSFAFSGDITERVTLGVRVAIDAGFGLRTIEYDVGGVVDSDSALFISVAPDLALGASLHLIPDHFSLHAGFGVGLFSFEQAVVTHETAGISVPGDKETTSKLGLPTARFGGGLTVNLTQALALDAMVFSSGLDFDATKFNLLLTLKK
jgi:opacity protein-like surface antigen